MNTGVKLAIGAAVVAGVTSYMAYVGAASSWKYYVTAEECLADQSKFVGSRVRVSGAIALGSLKVAADGSQANFSLAGKDGLLPVVCTGLLPDNLDEEMEVVVEGRLDTGGVLRGDKLLTRCASKYESEQTGTTPVGKSTKDTQGEP
jgi:cytochrome c-type biogenesis protein CcmE